MTNKKLVGNRREVVSYLIIGCLTTAVSWGTYALLRRMIDVTNPIQVQVAVIIRWVAGVTFAYITNRKIVFRSKARNIFIEFLKFVMTRITTLLLEMIVMFILVTIFELDDWISTFITGVFVVIANYIFSKLVVFNSIGEHKNK